LFGGWFGGGFGEGLGDFLSFIESPPIYNINKIRNSKNQVIVLKN